MSKLTGEIMFLKCCILYNKFDIKNILYVAGKIFPLSSIKDEQSSPHAWG